MVVSSWPVGVGPLPTLEISRARFLLSQSQNLKDYRKQLQLIDSEHRAFQADIAACKLTWRSEQINFLLLLGARRVTVAVVLLLCALLLAGERERASRRKCHIQ